MWEWLFAPIDPTRLHDIGTIVSWHGRLMMVSWGIMLPLGVFLARFFKIWPGQNWPQHLDNQNWWYSHLVLQWTGSSIAIFGLALIWWYSDGVSGQAHWHRWFGLTAMTLLVFQVLGGLLRGSKGGPTEPAPDGSWRGDHYNMSTRRICFEYCHKSLGYLAMVCAAAAMVSGIWEVNAPRWVWMILSLWWLALLLAAIVLQRRGLTIDTYQAIWGPELQHPGNLQKPIGFGIKRNKTEQVDKS